MRELKIAANMIAVARNRKGGSKRSAMLRMIMPFLSRETGDKLAEAINKSDSAHFAREWDKVKKEITARLAIQHKKHHHKATAADVSTFPREDSTSVSVRTYGLPEKIRININGNDVWEGNAPAETASPIGQPESAAVPKPEDSNRDAVASDGACANPYPPPVARVSIDSGQTGNVYSITDPQIVEMIKLVCERLLMGADPCPIPENRCVPHQWINCRECMPTETKPFDYNADILELYDRLVTCKSL